METDNRYLDSIHCNASQGKYSQPNEELKSENGNNNHSIFVENHSMDSNAMHDLIMRNESL
jgi:hypothetical protein